MARNGTESRTRSAAITVLAVALSVFHVYTASTTPLPAMIQRSIHVALASALVFLLYPAPKRKLQWLDWLAVALSFLVFAYTAYYSYDIALRMGLPTRWDVILGVTAVVLVLEGTRRAIGPALPLVSIAFLAYARWGNLLPGAFIHSGFDLERIITTLYLTTEGIYGVAIAVSATFVAVFVLFGAIFELSGGGKFFIDIARALVGHVRGGPAKVSVFSSAMFGTISGSIVANVVTTGSFTIPLMKSTGFQPAFAGGVEAAASTGGMITPPIMGAAAFVMAEILQIPYWKVALAGAIPAVLYYISIYFSVDFRAAVLGLRGTPREESGLTTVRVLRRDWPFLGTLAMLVYMIGVAKVTPMKAGIWSMWVAVAVAMVRTSTRFNLRSLLDSLDKAGRTIALVALPCACCGLIIGVFSLTGMGLKLSSILVEISGGSLLAMLLLSAVACIIMGMAGLITPAYIMLAIMVAPAMAKIGANTMAAHLFLVHYTSFADITPPVALGAYVAAGIACANSLETAYEAIRLVAPAFLVPFLFVFSPELILQGPLSASVGAFFTASIGVILCAAGLQGYFLLPATRWERICFVTASLLLIDPGFVTDVLGIVICFPAIASQVYKRRHKGKGTETLTAQQ